MKNTKVCIRLISVLLAMVTVFSLACVGILADTTDPLNPNTSATTNLTQGNQNTTSSDSSTGTTTETNPPEIISAYLDMGEYKKNYFSGDDFDPSNIYVVLSYIGLPTERIPLSEFGNYSPKTLSAGDTKVNVKVNDILIFDIPISVSDVKVESLNPSYDWTTFDNKYFEGEKFEAKGISLQVKYSNGETETISDASKFSVSPSRPLTKDDTKVAISYGGKSVVVLVNVTPVSSISVEPKETPLVLGQYQVFDRSLLKVTAHYSNGESRVIDDYTVEDGGLTAVGNGSINIKYYSHSHMLSVSVVELTSIRVDKKPAKENYNEGEFLISDGLKVNGCYVIGGNSTEREISGYTLSADKLIPDENKLATITVTFNEFFTDTFDVNVSPIVALNITALPSKLSYYEGEPLDMTGMTVQAVFENGSKLDNFTGFNLPEECVYVKASANPYIAYGEIKAEISVSVIAIKSIGVTKNPNRILYTEGEIFDPTGMEIMAEYADGTFKPVDIGACIFPTEPLKIFDTVITIKYEDFSYDFDQIIVSDKIYAKSLDAISLPNTSYVSGQTLSLEGLQLVLTLSNNQTVVIPLEEVNVSPAAGTQLFADIDTEIVIKYLYEGDQEVICTIPISVSNKAVISLFIANPPTKTEYTEGEIFDPTGMVVRAYYNDNTTEVITNYSVTNTPFLLSSSTAQDVRVFINVGESEQSFVVKVNPAIISTIAVTTPPSKVAYKVGETFDPSGMIVKVTFTNGTSLIVPSEMYSFGKDPFKAGDSVVTISFRDKTTFLSVSIDGESTTPPVDTITPPVTSEVTTPPESTTPKETTTSEVTTTSPDTTSKPGESKFGGLQILFICLIFFVVALIVVLVIYYRRHFC